MNLKELKELIEFLEEKNIAEFELERGDVKVRIKLWSTPTLNRDILRCPLLPVRRPRLESCRRYLLPVRRRRRRSQLLKKGCIW